MAVLDTNILINYYFEEISKIPRGSYNEEAIANYIVSIAEQYHLDYQRDEMNNVIVYKKATKGYEAHMDMVNEKNNDSHHDFENDSLDLYVEDGFLHAK